jgi:hypothetical protein
MQTVIYPNDVTTTYHYNHLNRLTDLIVQRGPTTLATFNYNPIDRTLGAAGERRAARETINSATPVAHNVNYDYDKLYRLTKETVLDGCQVAGKTSQGVAGENQPLLR